jgi:hypothetical protein
MRRRLSGAYRAATGVARRRDATVRGVASCFGGDGRLRPGHVAASASVRSSIARERQLDREPMASAEYINDRGDIVGHGVLANGEQRMFLLTRNPSVPLPDATASVARVRQSRRSAHRRLTPAQAHRLMSEFGPAARMTRRPAL